MESIDVTDEQHERLDALRESLAEDVGYGHVRPRDAVQYLLDEHDGEGPDVTAAGTGGSNAESGDADGEAGDDSADGAAGDEAGDAGSEDADGESADGDDSADDGDDKLSAMMNLLDTHDDKWEQADSEETRYVVDLPDGGTEEVQTKDDVKAILFKNY